MFDRLSHFVCPYVEILAIAFILQNGGCIVLNMPVDLIYKRNPSKQFVQVLYMNIDLELRNKTHGPMHYKIGVTCVFSGHEKNTLF